MDSLRREYGVFEKAKVWFSKKSVVVFTMGKVGTLTVCNSLRNIGYKHVHPHSLRHTRPGVHFIKVELTASKQIFYYVKTVLKRLKVSVWKALKPEILIITGVRDPFSRNMSAFFEQVHYIGGLQESDSSGQVTELFNKVCDFEAPLYWFDREVLEVTGIDVYDIPFDKERGIAVIEKGKYRLLVYRMDKLDSLQNEFAQFIGDKHFEILTTNASNAGIYTRQLRELKKSYRYSAEITHKFACSKYMKHFYLPEEIGGFVRKYGNN